jgi:nucleoside-diphosphate-sugar epimerase
MTRVLVTGGTGGLGGEVVNKLMKAGYQVARALLLARMRSMDLSRGEND